MSSAHLTPGVLTALLALMVGCATPKPSPDALRVDSLTFDGTKAMKAAEITDRIVTNATPWWSKWFPFLGGTVWFDINTWQADLRRIARVYEAHGYFQVRITDDLVATTDSGGITLKVKLTEGTPATLRRLDVRGLEQVPDLKPALLAKLPLKLNEVFLEDTWEKAKASWTEQLHEAGYAEAKVQGEATIDLDTPAVDASLSIEPGLRFRFGPLYAPVTGKVVPSKLIIDVAQSELPTSSWYSDSALAEAQARIFQMGVFGAVKVNRGIPDRDKAEMPIVIDAREAPMHSLRWGGGAGGDLIRNEARAFIEYTDRNLGFAKLFSKAALLDKLTLKSKLGYAVLPNLPEFINRLVTGEGTVRHGFVGDLSAQYEVPRVFNTRTVSLLTALGLNRTLDAAFAYYAAEGKLGFHWQPRLDLSIKPSLNLNAYLLDNPVTPMAGMSAAPSAAVGCPTISGALGFEDLCVVSFLELAAEWDRRDNKLEPKSGFFIGATGQLGLARSTQLTPFVKLVPEVRGYWSFGAQKQFTFAGKFRAGTLVGFGGGETPVTARFFSGGSNMRGFNQRRLSPMTVVKIGEGPLPSNELGPGLIGRTGEPLCQRNELDQCLEGALGATVPIGGNGLLEASLEFRVQLTEIFVLAFFIDNGMVTSEPLGATTDLGKSFYSAVGIGLRVRTPLGPIRTDFAYRLPFIGGPLVKRNPLDPAYLSQSGCFFNLGHTGSPTTREHLIACAPSIFPSERRSRCSSGLPGASVSS
jgi:translocation and assembly module TamA